MVETTSGSLVCLSRTLALGRIVEPIEATCGLRRANEDRRLNPQFSLYADPFPNSDFTSASPTMCSKRTSELGLAATPPPQTVHSSTKLPVPIGVPVRGEGGYGHEDGYIPEPRMQPKG